MEENKIMEVVNEESVETVYEGVSKVNGGTVAKVVAGVVGLAAIVGTVLFVRKKRKERELEAEVVTDEEETEDDE